MKKISFFLLITALVVGTVSAQNRNNLQRNNRSVTLEGTLQLERGNIAVSSGGSVYLVPSLTRYIGFIEELKEGTSVSVEGYVYNNVIYPVKVTIAGKSYDFDANGRDPGGYGMMGPGFRNDGFGMRRDNSGSGWGNNPSRRNSMRSFGCCG